MSYKFNEKVTDLTIQYLKKNDLLETEGKVNRQKYQQLENNLAFWFTNQLDDNQELKALANSAVLNIDFSDIAGDWGKANHQIKKLINQIKERLGLVNLDAQLEAELLKFLEFKMITGIRDWEAYEERRERDDLHYFKLLNSIVELKQLNQDKARQRMLLHNDRQQIKMKQPNKFKVVYLLSNGVKVNIINNDLIELDCTVENLDVRTLPDSIYQMKELTERTGGQELNFVYNKEDREIRNAINYVAMTNQLDFKVKVLDNEGNDSSFELSAGTQVKKLLNRYANEVQHGINFSEQLGGALMVTYMDRYWELNNRNVRQEAQQAITYAFENETINPFSFKHGLKYGNHPDTKARLRKIKHALEQHQLLSAEDLSYFQEMSAMVAKGRKTEFSSDKFCRTICDSLLNFKDSDDPKVRKNLIYDAANLVFAKLLANQSENPFLESVLDSEYREEILERVQTKIDKELTLFKNQEVYDELTANYDRILGIEDRRQKLKKR